MQTKKEGRVAKLGGCHFLFGLSPPACMHTAKASAQQKQELMPTQMSLTIAKCLLTRECRSNNGRGRIRHERPL